MPWQLFFKFLHSFYGCPLKSNSTITHSEKDNMYWPTLDPICYISSDVWTSISLVLLLLMFLVKHYPTIPYQIWCLLNVCLFYKNMKQNPVELKVYIFVATQTDKLFWQFQSMSWTKIKICMSLTCSLVLKLTMLFLEQSV